MTDLEYDVLDELYFVQSYDYLKKELDLNDEELKSILKELIEKGWVKCFIDHNQEVFDRNIDIDNKCREYFYLATKKGLMAHNVGE